MLVPVHLSRILIREMADMQVIELSESGGTRRFPIVIGLPEAFAIDRRIKGVQVARPQTHDLLAETIRALGGSLRAIHIHDLESGTFFAKLVIDRDGEVIEVDSRPSDAIALGVADGVPIMVEEHVIEEASADAAVEPPPEFGADAGEPGDAE
ncbi:MAG: bifunctional nuclease family protein [Planctomycetes bacterium]|jgi:bifunctional DNase/RNase|nr:bifunctional nuclease family protein [Planctomycetota bacterium]